MLNNRFMHQIYALFDKHSFFEVGDFNFVNEIIRDDEGDHATVDYIHLRITYNSDAQFYFDGNIHEGEHSLEMFGSFCPGEVLNRDNFNVNGTQEILMQIDKWLKQMHEEILALPVIRQLAEQQEEINKVVSSLNSLPDEYFTRHEAELIKTKLEELEQRFINHHKVAETKDIQLQDHLQQIHNNIETLKATVTTLKKNGWVKSAMVRTQIWLQNPANRSLLKSGAEFVKGLLTDGKDQKN